MLLFILEYSDSNRRAKLWTWLTKGVRVIHCEMGAYEFGFEQAELERVLWNFNSTIGIIPIWETRKAKLPPWISPLLVDNVMLTVLLPHTHKLSCPCAKPLKALSLWEWKEVMPLDGTDKKLLYFE